MRCKQANAHERWRQHQEEVERRIKHKEDEARARVQQLQKARVDETTAKSQVRHAQRHNSHVCLLARLLSARAACAACAARRRRTAP